MSLDATRMQLAIVLPHGEWLARDDVTRVYVETSAGNWCLLPNRADCVAAVVPGVLLYDDTGGTQHAVAVDEGVMVKAGTRVSVAVREAIAGAGLGDLRRAVEHEFAARAARESELNAALARLEAGFVRRITQYTRG